MGKISLTRKSENVPPEADARQKRPRCPRKAKFCVGQHVKVRRTHLQGDTRPPVYYHAVVRRASRRAGPSFRYDVSTPYFNQEGQAPRGQLRYREASVCEKYLFESTKVVPSDAIEVPSVCPAPASPQPAVLIKKNYGYIAKQENDRSFIRTGTVPCPQHAHHDMQEKFRLDLQTELSQCFKADIIQCMQDLAGDDVSTTPAASVSSTITPASVRRLALVQGLPDTFVFDFSKAKKLLSTLRTATLLERDVVPIIKDGVTSVRDPEKDYAKTPVRVSMSHCPGMHDVGTVQTNVRHWTDGKKEALACTNVETTLGFKYTYSPLCEGHAVSRCMPWRIRICLEELTQNLRSNGVLHHDVNVLSAVDVRFKSRGVD